MKYVLAVLLSILAGCASPVKEPVQVVLPVKKLSINPELTKPCVPYTTPLQHGTEAELVIWVGNLVKSYSDCAIMHEALVTTLKEYQ